MSADAAHPRPQARLPHLCRPRRGAARHLARHRQRRARRAGRRIRLAARSVTARIVLGLLQSLRSARIAGLRRIRGHAISRRCREPRAARPARHADVDDLPGPDLVAQSGLSRSRTSSTRSCNAATPASRGREARAERAPPRRRRDRRSRAGARFLSVPAVGRHEPARDDRDGAGQRAVVADRRRAGHRARRDRAGADARS